MDDLDFLATLIELENTNKAKSTVPGISSLMEQTLEPYPRLQGLYKELMLAGWKFVLTEQSRGWCSAMRKLITIPAWIKSPNKSNDFRVWYICHEMAHAIDKCMHNHGPEFMKILIDICPPEAIHHELGYKPRNATAAGIRKPRSIS